MGCHLAWVDQKLSYAAGLLGVAISKRPGYFFLIPVLVCCVFMTGIQRLESQYEDDPEYLFSPTDGRSKVDRAVIESYFPMNFSQYRFDRHTQKGRMARVLIFPKDNGTMLRTKYFKEVLFVDQMVRNVSFIYEDKELRFADVCATWDGECVGPGKELSLMDIMPDFETGKENLTSPIFIHPVTFDTLVVPYIFGGIQTNGEGVVTKTAGVSLLYWLRAGNQYEDKRGFLWEKAVVDALAKLNEGGLEFDDIYYFTSRTTEEELEANTNSVMPYFIFAVFVMVLFSCITCMTADWVRSKAILGLLGVVSSTLATLGAFGLVLYLGVPFIGINMAAPFLLLGIGMDDTFVMLAAWRRTRMDLPVSDRMRESFSEAAVSITITSLTNIISFFVGVITNIPCVRIFCIYTGTAVLALYITHLTFFGSCIAMFGYQEANNLHSITFQKVLPKSQAGRRSWLYRVFCAGGVSKEDPYNPEDNKDHAVMSFCKHKLARLLSIPAIKALVVMVFLAYLAMAAWGVTKTREGLERKRLSLDDSYSVAFYEKEETYFREFSYRVQVVFSGDIMYSDNATQEAIEEVMTRMEALEFVGDPLFTFSWLRSFLQFVRNNQEYIEMDISTEEAFIATLKEFFLTGEANPYALDVKLNEAEDRIIAARFIIQAGNMGESTNDDRILMEQLRDIIDSSPFNISAYQHFFVFFDQFIEVRPTAIKAITTAAIIMMVVSLIFIPHPMCSLWVAFSIISIETGVVGYMALWNVNLDSISMINLIMCIGFSVDFSAHISYAFMSAKEQDTNKRVAEALHHLGMPILQGSISTILGILALTFAHSYIFVTFFKLVFMVMFFGAVHGLFLLPVLLSLVGRGTCRRDRPKMEVDNPYMKALPPGIMAITSYIPPGTTLHRSEVVLKPASLDHKANFLPKRLYSDNLEKDMGLGTSGEDSSEGSLSKSNGRVYTPTRRYTFSSPPRRQPPVSEMYDSGNVSDEDYDRYVSRSRRKLNDKQGRIKAYHHNRGFVSDQEHSRL